MKTRMYSLAGKHAVYKPNQVIKIFSGSNTTKNKTIPYAHQKMQAAISQIKALWFQILGAVVSLMKTMRRLNYKRGG